MRIATVVLMAFFLAIPQMLLAQSTLSGNAKLACEALLCLSSGSRPSECAPSINKFFSIKKRTVSKTVDARKSFLNQCPTASYDGVMSALTNAMANSGGKCSAEDLNKNGEWVTKTDVLFKITEDECRAKNIKTDQYTSKATYFDGKGRESLYRSTACEVTERYFVISPVLPKSCEELLNHAYTNYGALRYMESSNPWESKWVEQ